MTLLADQVVLKNGDIITGSVIKKDGPKLSLKSEFLGEVSLPWTAVKSLKSDQDIVVVMPSGETVKGKIATNGENLEVATASGVKTGPLASVGGMRNEAEDKAYQKLHHPKFFDLWDGHYDLGFALARGNARTATLTNAFVATRATDHGKFSSYFNQIYATATTDGISAATASAIHTGWAYNHDIAARIFASVNNDYDHDRFQDLQLRAVIGGGLGLNVVKTNKTLFTVQAGADFERENFTGAGGFSRNSGEVNWGDDLNFKFSSVSSLTQSFRMFENLSEPGEYRVNFDLSAATAIKKWLAFHVTGSDRFLSNPVEGRLRNDIVLSTGFRLSFSSK